MPGTTCCCPRRSTTSCAQCCRRLPASTRNSSRLWGSDGFSRARSGSRNSRSRSLLVDQVRVEARAASAWNFAALRRRWNQTRSLLRRAAEGPNGPQQFALRPAGRGLLEPLACSALTTDAGVSGRLRPDA